MSFARIFQQSKEIYNKLKKVAYFYFLKILFCWSKKIYFNIRNNFIINLISFFGKNILELSLVVEPPDTSKRSCPPSLFPKVVEIGDYGTRGSLHS